MPNYCQNLVQFTHQDPQMIARVIKGFGEQLFNEFIPEPIPNNEFNYHWYIENWGTTGDVYDEYNILASCNVDIPKTYIELSFDTRWSPPIEFYKFMERNLNFKIKAFYVETGNNFYGVYENGVDTSYEFIEIFTNPNIEISQEFQDFFSHSIGDDWRECMDDWDIGQDEEQEQEDNSQRFITIERLEYWSRLGQEQDDDSQEDDSQDDDSQDDDSQRFITMGSQYDILFS